MKKRVLALVCAMIMICCTGCGASNPAASSDSGSASATEGTESNKGTAPEGALADIVEQIYAVKEPGIGVGTIPVELSDADAVKMYTGLDSADAISEAVASEAMISAQAYSLVLVRVKDAADTASVAEEMEAGIDPRKWVCVEADDLQVVACDDVILLIMVSSELSDSVTSQDVVDAFREVCGGTLTIE